MHKLSPQILQVLKEELKRAYLRGIEEGRRREREERDEDNKRINQ